MKLWKLNTQILISSINFAIKFMNSLFLLKFEFMCLYLLLVFATSVIIEQETGENLSLIVSHLFYEFWRFNLILLIKFNGIARSQTWISFLSKIISDYGWHFNWRATSHIYKLLVKTFLPFLTSMCAHFGT